MPEKHFEALQGEITRLTEAVNAYLKLEEIEDTKQSKAQFYQRLLVILSTGTEDDLLSYLVASKAVAGNLFRVLHHAMNAYDQQNISYVRNLSYVWENSYKRIERAAAIESGLELLSTIRGYFNDEEWGIITYLAESTAGSKPAPELVLSGSVSIELVSFINETLSVDDLNTLREFFIAVLPKQISTDPEESKGYLHLVRINAKIAEKLGELEQPES